MILDGGCRVQIEQMICVQKTQTRSQSHHWKLEHHLVEEKSDIILAYFFILLYLSTSSYFDWFWQRRAKLFNCLATSGCSLPRTRSRISRARTHSGSASRYLPRFPYRTAKLLRVAATAGWFSPRVFSRISNASLRRFAASWKDALKRNSQ